MAPSGAPQNRAHLRAIDDRARPDDPLGLMELGQQHLVQPLPDALLVPLLQPPPGGHPRPAPDLLGEMLPGDARLQHEQDARKHPAIIDPLSPGMAKSPRHLRDQRLDHLPELVADDRPGHGRPPRASGRTSTSSQSYITLFVRSS